MKRKILLALIIFLGCKNSNVDQLSTIKGSYIFFEDAAVLQNTNEIYGVFMNEKARELNTLAKNYGLVKYTDWRALMFGKWIFSIAVSMVISFFLLLLVAQIW